MLNPVARATSLSPASRTHPTGVKKDANRKPAALIGRPVDKRNVPAHDQARRDDVFDNHCDLTYS